MDGGEGCGADGDDGGGGGDEGGGEDNDKVEWLDSSCEEFWCLTDWQMSRWSFVNVESLSWLKKMPYDDSPKTKLTTS